MENRSLSTIVAACGRVDISLIVQVIMLKHDFSFSSANLHIELAALKI